MSQGSKNKYSFTRIKDLTIGPSFNLYGKVICLKPPARTRGTDYVMTLVLRDDSFSELDGSDEGIQMVIFKPSESQFPPVTKALSTNWSAFTVFDRDEDGGHWKEVSTGEIPSEEILAVLDKIDSAVPNANLPRACSSLSSPSVTTPSSKAGNRPTWKIEDIIPDKFFDFVGQVIKVLPQSKPEQLSILLSDYTYSPMIRVRPADFDVESDLEGRLLLVTFWDNHVEKASTLEAGQSVRLINLHSKNLSGSSDYEFMGSSGGLIAVLHGDRSNNPKIFILADDSAERSALETMKKRLFEVGGENHAAKRPKESANTTVAAAPQTPQKQISSFETQAHTQIFAEPTHEAMTNTSGSPTKHGLTTILHESIPITPLQRVLSTEQCPAKFVVKARIARIHPENVEDCTRYFCSPCQRAVSTADLVPACPLCARPLSTIVFLFSLILTDGRSELPIIAAHHDAIQLLNGMTPTNLRQDRDSREYLQDILQQLVASPRPALFCIKSYRAKPDGPIRYRIFDTFLTTK